MTLCTQVSWLNMFTSFLLILLSKVNEQSTTYRGVSKCFEVHASATGRVGNCGKLACFLQGDWYDQSTGNQRHIIK